MSSAFIVKSWDSTGKFKAKFYDVELWLVYPRPLINKGKSYNFTPEDIKKYGSKEKATREYFRLLGEEGRNMSNQGLKAKVLRIGIKVVTPFIDVPPQYRKIYEGDE